MDGNAGGVPDRTMAAGASGSDGRLDPCNSDKLLICDDEKTIVLLFQMIVSSAFRGVEVETAGNGAEALRAFERGRHRVLLMDLHMPVMDGYAAFCKVRQMCEARHWRMPSFVFCTGFAPPATLGSILAASPEHALLAKPVSPDRLVDTIRRRLT